MGDLFGEDDEGPGSLFASIPKENPSKEEKIELPDVFSQSKAKKEEKIEKKQAIVIEETVKTTQISAGNEKEIQNKPKKKEIIEMPASQPKKPKKTKKKEIIHIESETKKAVDLLRNELQYQFDTLSLILESIPTNDNCTMHLSLPTDSISEHIRGLIRESDAKDNKLREQEQQIKKLSDIFNEKKEKEQLKKDITELEKELEEGKNTNHDENLIKALNSEMSNLLEELSQIESQRPIEEENLKNSIQEETNKQVNKIEQEIKDLIDTKEIIDASIPQIEQQIKTIKHEAASLKETISNDTSNKQEIDEIKQRIAKKTSIIVRELASGTLEYIEDGINKETTYRGSQCVAAIKTALSTVADEILNPDESDSEGEEQEEEDD